MKAKARRRPEPVDLDGVVDDEVGRDQGIDPGRVAAEVGHRVAHDREVDDGGHAGEVLEDDPRGHERDLGLGGDARPPGGERLDVGRLDHPPPAWRSRFSSRIRTVTGSVASPSAPPRASTAIEVREARSERRPGAEGVDPWQRVHLRRLATLDACKRTAPADRRGRATDEGVGQLPGDGRGATAQETEAAIEPAGIDLDPVPPGTTATATRSTPTATPIPHSTPGPGEPPDTGIVGAGAVGTALGVALSRAGWPIHAVASRDAGRRERFTGLVDGARAFAEPQALVEEVELVIVAVPDDALAPLAAGVRMYGGQAMVHTSGALGAEVLAPAMAAGTQVGAFHPLVAFADTERAVAALHGATVAVEGDDQLAALLAEMAERSGRRRSASRRDRRPPTTRRPSSPPAASSPCSTRSPSWAAVAGLDEAGSLAIYGPLIEGTLGNARALGIRAALTGPMTRGDVGHARGAPRGAGARTRRARWSCTSPPPAARSTWRSDRGALAPETAEAMRARRRRGACKGRLTRYHCGPWDTASPPSTRPGRRRDSSARPAARGSGDWASSRPSSFSAVAARPTELRGPGSRPVASLHAGWRGPRPGPTARPRRPAATAGPDALGPLGRPVRAAVPAPPRRRGTPEDRDRHLRGWHRRPVRGRATATRRRQSPARARRSDLDPAQGHARSAARRTEETALREVAEETGLQVRITGPLGLDRVLVRPVGDAHPQDRPLLPHGAGRRRPVAGHDHEFDQVRWIDFDEAPSILTFETERALVAPRRRRSLGVRTARTEPAS